jgi:hypothetical protein
MGAHSHLSGSAITSILACFAANQTNAAKDRITGQRTCAGPVRFAQVSGPVFPDHRLTTQLT